MKNVLILKTPFKGIRKYINELVRTTGHNFYFLEYSNEETTPFNNYGRHSVYNPDNIIISTPTERRKINIR